MKYLHMYILTYNVCILIFDLERLIQRASAVHT